MTARTLRILRWLALIAVITSALADSNILLRGKRQVTYQGEDYENQDPEPDIGIHSVHPVTRKPLPNQMIYPGDLSSFFTTEPTPQHVSKVSFHLNLTSKDVKATPVSLLELKFTRGKRGAYTRDKSKDDDIPLPRTSKSDESLRTKEKDSLTSESRQRASYQKPSATLMNDIPSEMSFDGAGFLRSDDVSEEDQDLESPKARSSSGTRRNNNQGNNKALSDFQAAFNISKERNPSTVQFNDEDSSQYHHVPFSHQGRSEEILDREAQGTEAFNPAGMEFMTSYQNAMLQNMNNNYAPQTTQHAPSMSQSPFTFNYPYFNNEQPQMDHMTPTRTQQESLLHNHRMEPAQNSAVMNGHSFYSPNQQQGFPSNQAYAPSFNFPQFKNVNRRKRSTVERRNVDLRAKDTTATAPQEARDNFMYSRSDGQQESGSGFIPITGNFNGGTIQLSFPFYGSQSPMGPSSYSSGPPSPPMGNYHTYSVPANSEGPQYRSPHYYHPSEARRFSYGILGSGNFEVIPGGIYNTERHHGRHGGYTDGRIPYRNNEFDNYGTTEIILDGPVLGFQGFDNFPAHLINALSKHSELSVQSPDRRESESRRESIVYPAVNRLTSKQILA